jgi:hypothetical protein
VMKVLVVEFELVVGALVETLDVVALEVVHVVKVLRVDWVLFVSMVVFFSDDFVNLLTFEGDDDNEDEDEDDVVVAVEGFELLMVDVVKEEAVERLVVDVVTEVVVCMLEVDETCVEIEELVVELVVEAVPGIEAAHKRGGLES